MILAFVLTSAVNLLFLLLVAFCLAVGLLIAPQLHEGGASDAEGHTDIPPAFRDFDGPE